MYGLCLIYLQDCDFLLWNIFRIQMVNVHLQSSGVLAVDNRERKRYGGADGRHFSSRVVYHQHHQNTQHEHTWLNKILPIYTPRNRIVKIQTFVYIFISSWRSHELRRYIYIYQAGIYISNSWRRQRGDYRAITTTTDTVRKNPEEIPIYMYVYLHYTLARARAHAHTHIHMYICMF